jgi:predicted nucleic acid-binding protein
LRYVLDANVYILAFGGPPLPKIDEMLEVLVSHPDRFELVVGRTILSEIQRHQDTGAMHACWDLLKAIEAVPVEDWQIPYELGEKYRELGFKSGDASIAALTESAGAEYLVTENRDFMDRSRLPFRVVRIAEFLKVVKQHPS